ncbi:pyridoxal phosphate-dependent aminotransferase [Zavarzinella formosa]|uniref:pyridoxal phosphate-dependent aminotransferase n=1 Tax=Zavarzinella formosa TaxID=360055 RepID=UPI0002EAF311|nr:pyridoxal phosphate-dependent aminotransferase [Zavarzinella formosa]
MILISKLAASVQPSATLAAGAKAKQMKAAGIRVFDFSIGEPDFPTPQHICDAADKAMAAGHTHYTPVNGIPELKAAICRWYKRYHQFDITPDMVIVSNGAKHSIHNTLSATLNPGDEVVIPAPYWVSYSDLVAMTGAVPVIVPTTAASGFKMSPAQLKAAITPRTKLLMINSPNNPTGTVYSREELLALADVILETNVSVLSDEIYEQLVYGTAKPTCFAALKPELRERTITISGASKSYAMTGWRMGWAIAVKPLVDAMGNVQSQQTSCPSSVSQYALLAALDGPQECVEEMRKQFEVRRNLVYDKLSKIPGVTFPKTEGAFYVFFDVSSYFGKTISGVKITDSFSFSKACLENAHVNLVPGSAFGAEGFVRMSYASANSELEEGTDALAKWLATAS